MNVIALYSDPILAAERAELHAAHIAAMELERITGKTAMQRAIEAIHEKGWRLRRELVKRAARQYRADPRLLDKIRFGLSMAHPAFVMAAIEQKRRIPWGRIDMLGVVPINDAGAYLHARWERRQMYRERAAARAVRVATTNQELVG